MHSAFSKTLCKFLSSSLESFLQIIKKFSISFLRTSCLCTFSQNSGVGLHPSDFNNRQRKNAECQELTRELTVWSHLCICHHLTDLFSIMVLICLFKVLSFALTSEDLYAMETRVIFFSLWCPGFPRHDCHIKVVVSEGIPALKHTLQEPDLLCEHTVGASTWGPTTHFLTWGESTVGAQRPVLQSTRVWSNSIHSWRLAIYSAFLKGSWQS